MNQMADNSGNCNFEYMNESSINEYLKCELCKKPFTDPVSTPCKHIFCGGCIENHLKSGSICPKSKCHQPLSAKNLETLKRGIAPQMLDEIAVKCTLCQQTDIRRGKFPDHITKHCTKTTLRCLAADINCSWTGPRDQLNQHSTTCVFQRLKPMFYELIEVTKQQSSRIEQLEKQSQTSEILPVYQQHYERLEEELRMLQIQINKLQSENKSQTDEIVLINQQYRHLEDIIKKLEAENQNQRDENACANQSQAVQLENRIKELQTESQNQIAEAVTSIQQQCAELKSEMDGIQLVNQQFSDLDESIKKQEAENQTRYDVMMRDTQQHRAQLEELEAEITKLKSESKSRTDEKELVNQPYRHLEDIIQKLEAENQNQRDQNARANQSLAAQLEDRIKELQIESRNQMVEAVAFIQQQCTELKSEISELRIQHKSGTDDIRLVNQQFSYFNESIKKLQAENQNLTDEKVLANQSQAAQLEDPIKELQTESRNQMVEMVTLIQQQCTELKSEISELRIQHKSETDDTRLVNQQFSYLDESIKKLETENKTRYDEMVRDTHQHSAQLEEQIRECKTEIQNQKTEAMIITEQWCTKLEAEITKLQNENKSQADEKQLANEQGKAVASSRVPSGPVEDIRPPQDKKAPLNMPVEPTVLQEQPQKIDDGVQFRKSTKNTDGNTPSRVSILRERFQK
jgi:chromosome segregation ATPase